MNERETAAGATARRALEAWEAFERRGADSILDGQDMIYASVLEEIAGVAREELYPLLAPQPRSTEGAELTYERVCELNDELTELLNERVDELITAREEIEHLRAASPPVPQEREELVERLRRCLMTAYRHGYGRGASDADTGRPFRPNEEVEAYGDALPFPTKQTLEEVRVLASPAEASEPEDALSQREREVSGGGEWTVESVPCAERAEPAGAALLAENQRLRAELAKAQRKADLMQRQAERVLPCPDHRDKTVDGKCYVCENHRLRIALHDAIRRPLGVVPDSAAEFYDPAMADEAERRCPQAPTQGEP